MTIRDTVYALLARHVSCAKGDVHPWQHLEHDLDLTPLELVLMAVELEEAEELEMDMEQLVAVETVEQLVSTLSRMVARGRRAKGMSRVA